MDLKKIGTKRLLTLFRNLRTSILSREPDGDPRYYDEKIEEDNLLEAMKTELDTREHVPHKRPGKDIVSRNVKIRRK